MYLLRKQLCYLAEEGLDATAQPLLVIMHGRHIPAFRVTAAADQQSHAVGFRQLIFPLVISVSGIGCHIRPRRQSQRQLGQPLKVGETTGQDGELYGKSSNCRDDLYTDSEEVAALARQIAAKLRPLSQPAAGDADVVADGNGERIEAVTALHIQLLDDESQPVKEHPYQIGEPRESAREPGAREHARHHPGRVEKRARPLEVAAEVEHGNDGRCHYFGVREMCARVFAVLDSLEQVVNETVYCEGTVVHARSPFLLAFCLATKA